MSIVIDASITLPWYFQDEVTAETEAVFNRVIAEGAVAPAHWKLEVTNGFRTALLRRRIDRTYRDESLKDLASLAIEIDTASIRQAWTATLDLADRYQLTPYDAAYLELAIRHNLPLATLDKELVAAIKLAGVERA
jgi:predicted nucleic acid-binding protein